MSAYFSSHTGSIKVCISFFGEQSGESSTMTALNIGVILTSLMTLLDVPVSDSFSQSRTESVRQIRGGNSFFKNDGEDAQQKQQRTLTDQQECIALSSVNNDDTVTVTLRQVEFGLAPELCGPDVPDHATAENFFAIYTDPSTGELECDFHRKADACFESSLTIACDDETNYATVELFIRDEMWSVRYDQVPNPQIGRCLNTEPILGMTRSWKASFECFSPEAEDPSLSPVEEDPRDAGLGLGKECTSDDDCSTGHFCASSWLPMDPSTCQAFEPEGGSCGAGVFAPGFFPRCDPATMYCEDNPMTCTRLTDGPGCCKKIGGTCASDSDCDASLYYCDEMEGICKEVMQLSECCDDIYAPCAPGLTCSEIDAFGSITYVCQ